MGINMDSSHLCAQASTNYKEAFSLFDKRGTGRVPADELGDLLRACGQNPTLSEVAELQKGVGRECTYILYSLAFPLSFGEFQRMGWFG
jgi:Ca2+-binding EF-hand superfamily protein